MPEITQVEGARARTRIPAGWPPGAAVYGPCAGSSDARTQRGQVEGEGARARGHRCVRPMQTQRRILSSLRQGSLQIFFALVLPFGKYCIGVFIIYLNDRGLQCSGQA